MQSASQRWPDDDRARRRRLGGQALQPARAAHAVARELADRLREVGRLGRDRVVVARLEAHDARRLRGAEPDGEDRAERDRHLAEGVARLPLADDALDPVDELDRLDPALQHGEQRALGALVRRVLARHEGDVRGQPRELLDLRGRKPGEERDLADLFRGHHADQPNDRRRAGQRWRRRYARGSVRAPRPERNKDDPRRRCSQADRRAAARLQRARGRRRQRRAEAVRAGAPAALRGRRARAGPARRPGPAGALLRHARARPRAGGRRRARAPRAGQGRRLGGQAPAGRAVGSACRPAPVRGLLRRGRRDARRVRLLRVAQGPAEAAGRARDAARGPTAAQAVLEGAARVLRRARARGDRARRPADARPDLRAQAQGRAGGLPPPARRRALALPRRRADPRAVDEVPAVRGVPGRRESCARTSSAAACGPPPGSRPRRARRSSSSHATRTEPA